MAMLSRLRTAFFFFTLLLLSTSVLAAPSNTRPNMQGMVISTCGVGVPIVGGGSSIAPTCVLGSGGTGDIYYQASGGLLTRLGIGSTGQILEVVSGLPSWQTVSGSGTVTSVTCFGTAITTSGTCATTGQIPGIATNTAATGGNVGEYISSTVLVGAAVPLSTGVAANVTSVSLTAGDWDCDGNVFINPAGTTPVSQAVAAISNTSATIPTTPCAGACTLNSAPISAGLQQGLVTGKIRELLAATTPVYLIGYAAFTVSTASAFGFIGCRRMR
jgi:hypothetical protein